ncbi:MAG: ribonuclease Y [Candidatus Cloacimonetes bacterium]|nr:ribonuclease Y [Candidatus Cloacimonadota bacterium]
MNEILLAIIGLVVGVFIGWLSFRLLTSKKVKQAHIESQKIKDEARLEAKVIKKEAEIEAKEDWYKRKANLEKEIEERKKELRKIESNYNQRISNIDERLSKLDRREQSITDRERHLQNKQTKLDDDEAKLKEMLEQEAKRLMEIANLTKEQAIEMLLKKYENEARIDAAKLRKTIIDKANSEADDEAVKIIANAIQRTAVDYVTESTVSVVDLPSEEMKGRIIGREGRNIRTFESSSGVEIIVDDTPEAVIVSSFDPVRREIAKRALEKLISDGRIHPGRIEDIIAKSEKEVNKIIEETGKKTLLDLAIHDLPDNLKTLIGRLKYRTSYGQNMLKHSIESAWICGMLAAELGLDQALARKIGLLHDIGKAVDHEIDGSHATIGADLARRNGLQPVIVNAIEAHHEEVDPESVYAVLVQVADAVSGARPGARRETLESYLKRLEKLEEIAYSFEGVHKCFAIQAGREIRIMVEHTTIDDAQAELLASDVAKKIENDLQYPGQIKVTVIREIRKTVLAK